MARAAKAVWNDARCSFCGSASDAVNKLVAGPGVYICDGCIQLCNEILEQEGAGPQHPGIPWRDALDDDAMLSHIGRVASTSTQVNRSLQTWVDALRGRGVTWARIGAALGMTRQSAWERFSGEE